MGGDGGCLNFEEEGGKCREAWWRDGSGYRFSGWAFVNWPFVRKLLLESYPDYVILSNCIKWVIPNLQEYIRALVMKATTCMFIYVNLLMQSTSTWYELY